VHIFRHLFLCFQTNVYTLEEFHQTTISTHKRCSILDSHLSFSVFIFYLCYLRNNSALFEELEVSIADLIVASAV
jgi:hypothetical protein